MSTSSPDLGAAQRSRLERRALLLAYATLGYNAVEAAVGIAAGLAAGSTALVAFGGDSIVECLSAAVIVWQFRSPVPQQRERQALRGIAVAFGALAVYVVAEAVHTLVTRADADASSVGVGLALASLVVMPVLARAKQRVARGLGSSAVQADSMQTWLCTYLSAVLLAGLLLDSLLGWWWADPVAALVIAGIAVNEAREAWRGENDCDC